MDFKNIWKLTPLPRLDPGLAIASDIRSHVLLLQFRPRVEISKLQIGHEVESSKQTRMINSSPISTDHCPESEHTTALVLQRLSTCLRLTAHLDPQGSSEPTQD